MLSFFFCGLIVYTIVLSFRIILVFAISRYFKQSFKENYQFDWLKTGVEAFLLGAVFSLGSLVGDSDLNSFLKALAAVFCISMIPTFLFVIEPLRYQFNPPSTSEYKYDSTRYKKLNTYNIKIIEKDVYNAYATGVIPFTKTILVGRPLIQNLTEKEVISIIFHEAGHLKFNHLGKLYAVNIIVSALSYFIFQVRQLVFQQYAESIQLATVFLSGCIIGFLLWYIPGKMQYHFELEADAYASTHNGSENLKSALTRLDQITKGEVSSGGITHPALDIRIKHFQTQ